MQVIVVTAAGVDHRQSAPDRLGNEHDLAPSECLRQAVGDTLECDCRERKRDAVQLRGVCGRGAKSLAAGVQKIIAVEALVVGVRGAVLTEELGVGRVRRAHEPIDDRTFLGKVSV